MAWWSCPRRQPQSGKRSEHYRSIKDNKAHLQTATHTHTYTYTYVRTHTNAHTYTYTDRQSRTKQPGMQLEMPVSVEFGLEKVRLKGFLEGLWCFGLFDVYGQRIPDCGCAEGESTFAERFGAYARYTEQSVV